MGPAWVLLALCSLGSLGRAQEWTTRWGGDCVGGVRPLEVLCVDDDLSVDESRCDDDRPAAGIGCSATTLYVDSALGDDGNDGSEAAPLLTLAACISRGADLSTTKNPPDETEAQLVCALRGGTYSREASTPLNGIDHLLVTPARADDVVVFDGTDPVLADWHSHETLSSVKVASVAGRRPEVLVGGRGLMCANEAAIPDGGHEPKIGFGTKTAPCFVWEPEDAWVLGGTAFSMNDAVSYYEEGDESVVPEDVNLPWFWVDESRGRVFVDQSRAPANAMALRIKNPSRADIFDIGDASHRIYVRGVHFYGTSCCGGGPETSSLTSQDLRITNSRFLYAPAAGVRLKTTKQSKRGGTPYASFVNNTLEFGENALFYKGTGCTIQGNYLVFNSFEARGDYTLDNQAQRSLVTDNTLLYNGDKGGHFSWARGHQVRRNLIIGQDFLGPKFDAAVFHAQVSAQQGLLIERNWVLGPSLVSFARLDTSQSTTSDEAGRYTTIRHNVHFGLGMTLKGYNHTVEHNTGSRFLVVESWAAIDNHNYASVIRYNAHTETVARASTAAHDAIPGLSSLNLCGEDLRVCNPGNATAPTFLARQLKPLVDGVQAELVAGEWPGLDTSGVGEGDEAFNEAGVVNGDALLGSRQPWQIATPLATAMDFRPTSSGRLAFECGSDCAGDGATYDYVDKPPTWTAWDDYVGAYAADDEQWIPGCYACVPGGAYAGEVFPYAPTAPTEGTSSVGASSLSHSTSRGTSRGTALLPTLLSLGCLLVGR